MASQADELLRPLAPSSSPSFFQLPPSSLLTRVLVITALQTLAMFVLYAILAVLAPLTWRILLTLLGWTAALSFVILMVVIHIFNEVVLEARKLAVKIYITTSIAEGLSYLLFSISCPAFTCLFLCISFTAQSILCVSSLFYPQEKMQKVAPRLLLWVVVCQALITLPAYPISFIFWTFCLSLLDCLYLITALDESIRLTTGKEGGWKDATRWALLVQNRKFACALDVLPRTWRAKVEDFLPVGEEY